MALCCRHGLVHKQCLSCGLCKRTLNASTFCDGADDDVYCKPCYTDNFGVVGREDIYASASLPLQ